LHTVFADAHTFPDFQGGKLHGYCCACHEIYTATSSSSIICWKFYPKSNSHRGRRHGGRV